MSPCFRHARRALREGVSGPPRAPPGDTLITGTPWWAETNSRSPLHSNPLYISRLLSLVPYATTQSYSSNPFFLSHVRSVAVPILVRAMCTRGLYTTKSTRGLYTTKSHTDEPWGARWDRSSLTGLTNPGCAPPPLSPSGRRRHRTLRFRTCAQRDHERGRFSRAGEIIMRSSVCDGLWC